MRKRCTSDSTDLSDACKGVVTASFWEVCDTPSESMSASKFLLCLVLFLSRSLSHSPCSVALSVSNTHMTLTHPTCLRVKICRHPFCFSLGPLLGRSTEAFDVPNTSPTTRIDMLSTQVMLCARWSHCLRCWGFCLSSSVEPKPTRRSKSLVSTSFLISESQNNDAGKNIGRAFNHVAHWLALRSLAFSLVVVPCEFDPPVRSNKCLAPAFHDVRDYRVRETHGSIWYSTEVSGEKCSWLTKIEQRAITKIEQRAIVYRIHAVATASSLQCSALQPAVCGRVASIEQRKSLYRIYATTLSQHAFRAAASTRLSVAMHYKRKIL